MDSLCRAALFRTFGFLLWILSSAWLFSMVENTEKDNVEEKYQMLLSLFNSMASKYNMTVEEFNNFSNLAYEALTDPKPQWTYTASVDFIFQTLTTIGYGYITPQTTAGQILCIFVCFLGIPITLLTLKSIGELIVKLVDTIVTNVEKKILKRAEPKQVEIKSFVILFSITVVLLVISTWISMISWDLTFVEGLYFWFITLTTIGFGDYTPFRPRTARQSIKFLNTSENHLNKYESAKANGKETTALIFLNVLFILGCTVGLCILSSVLNSMMAALDVHERKCHLRCSGCVSRNRKNHIDSEQQHNTPQQDETEMTHISMENARSQKETMASVG